MDNNTNNTVSSNSGKVNLTKDKKIAYTEQKIEDFQTDTGTSHSYETTGRHSFGILCLLIDGVQRLFSFIVTIIVIFVIAGFVTGNLKSWSENLIYYSTAVMHTVKNISLPHRYEKESAEYILSKYITALFSGDQYTANRFIDTTEAETVRATDIIVNTFRTSRSDRIMDFLVNDMSKADYKIIANSTDNAKFTLAFTTYDYQIIINKTENELSQYDYQILMDDSFDQSDEDIALKTLKSYVYKAPKNLKFSVDFMIEEYNGSYQIIDFNARELVCAMTGNMVLSLDENYLDAN